MNNVYGIRAGTTWISGDLEVHVVIGYADDGRPAGASNMRWWTGSGWATGAQNARQFNSATQASQEARRLEQGR